MKLLIRKIWIPIAALALLAGAAARADNAACWGDESRGDITCAKITEPLLLSLRGQTIDAVRKAFAAPGRDIEKGLHFLSNYSRGEKTGSGDVNVAFEDGRATTIQASVDSPSKVGEFEFIWTAYAAPTLGSEIDHTTKNFRRAPFCSDFSGQPAKCTGDDTIDHQLTLLQMQGGLTKADLLKLLEVSCDPGQGLIVTDAAGDCARLRERLR
ncbi:hypothetical protein [Rhodopila sp.]|uniref:hypothetical protein n=1 Tax=Rhodopila sp. TaxID=2480087 RepID=UPI003D12FBC7